MLEQWVLDAASSQSDRHPVSRHALHALDPRAGSSTRRRLERDLRAAVAGGGLLLYYQPRLHLGSGAIVAAEALLRWPHPRQGLISPGTFFPIAERTDLVNEIGRFVLATACREAEEWPASATHPAPSVSVNVSARQLADGVLLDHVSTALELSGLSPERLELELAETMLREIDLETLLALSAIRDLGVGLALDNFGAVHASLATLKRLPLTTVKIDRSLIRGLPGDLEDAAIVRAAITTGHALGLTVVAEGIEAESQRAFLSGIGCDEGQGFLFSHPQPPAAFATRLLLMRES